MKDLIEFIEEVKSRKKGKLNNLILSELGVQLLQDDVDCCNRMIEMIRKQKKPIKLYEANIKWIEDIIEIVLDNVSCEHSGAEDHDVGGIMGHVDYSLDNDAYQSCKGFLCKSSHACQAEQGKRAEQARSRAHDGRRRAYYSKRKRH